MGHDPRPVSNMVDGVSQGFTSNLEINGVGYRAAVQGKNLKLQLGYSHDVNFPIPEGIQIKCDKPTSIRSPAPTSSRSARSPRRSAPRPPEPYKGKGIKYGARRSSARKARRSKAMPHGTTKLSSPAASGARATACARPPAAVRAFRCSARAAYLCAGHRRRAGKTLAAASTLDKALKGRLKTGADIEAAKAVGKLIAERADAAGVKEVVFDRGGYMFHGRVKALADAAREGGLSF